MGAGDYTEKRVKCIYEDGSNELKICFQMSRPEIGFGNLMSKVF